MKLHNGSEVNVLGEIQIDNKPHAIVKLPNAVYVSGAIVSHILLPMSEFKDYCDKKSAESIKAEPIKT